MRPCTRLPRGWGSNEETRPHERAGYLLVVREASTRKGLLRFVLDGEGYDVVAEAATTAELARVMAVHRPDVVVLDDGIGAVAVGMINEMSPATDVILVWPGAVMPVGGAARVEPSRACCKTWAPP